MPIFIALARAFPVEHGQMSLTAAQTKLHERIQEEKRLKYARAATLHELAARRHLQAA